MTGKIYCISNNINNNLYIGKTTYPNIETRFKEHQRDSRKEKCKDRPLYRAINKYGFENFTISLIDECDIRELEAREQYWIDYYDTYNNGYNATKGGDGRVLYDYDLFIEDYLSGMLVIEIANKHGCGPDIITKALHLAGIDGHTNKINRSKNPVDQYDKNDNFIQSFESQRAAARYLISQGSKGNITSITNNIGRVLKGTRKTAEGFIWKKP